MKKILIRSLNTSGVLVALFAANLHALTPSEWKYQQPITVETAKPLKFSLPVQTLDRLQPDLRDLRIVGQGGLEVPYLLLKPVPEPAQIHAPKRFHVELQDNATVIVLETGTSLPLASIELTTRAFPFLKPARIERSSDGQRWETVAEGMPFFRQDGAQQTALSLGNLPAAFVRVTLGDQRTHPIAITGATLHTESEAPVPTETLGVKMLPGENFANETMLTLDLGASNLTLASLEFVCTEPVFTRQVSVAVREFHDDEITERVIARGTIYRIALEGVAPASRLELPVDALVPGHEVIVHIENGDNQPLNIREVHATRRPIYAVFIPDAPGRYNLLAGNSLARAPNYDLALLGAKLGPLPVTVLSPDAVAANPDYHQAESLAGLPMEGAALDTTPWKLRKPVVLASAGVQQLELDLDVLAAAQPDFSDLRLLRAGNQVPYILERTNLFRPLPLVLASGRDPSRPTVSRWKVVLPRAHLPITRLSLSSPTALFQRHFGLYESLTDERGNVYEAPLADSDWVRTPDSPARALVLTLNTHPQTDTLWLETDNADNPPIVLEHAQAFYPVTRLLFKTSPESPATLLYGNAQATAPRYDLGLVAAQLLTAEKFAATLGNEESSTNTTSPSLLKGLHAGVIFWAALAIVVVLLLAIVAKLLPKPPTDGKP